MPPARPNREPRPKPKSKTGARTTGTNRTEAIAAGGSFSRALRDRPLNARLAAAGGLAAADEVDDLDHVTFGERAGRVLCPRHDLAVALDGDRPLRQAELLHEPADGDAGRRLLRFPV